MGSNWYLRRTSPYKTYAYVRQNQSYFVKPANARFNVFDNHTKKDTLKVLLDEPATQNIQLIIPTIKLKDVRLRDGRVGKLFYFYFDKTVSVNVSSNKLGKFRLSTKSGAFLIIETDEGLRFYKSYSHKLLNTFQP